MALSPRLEIRQTQSLVMTPQLMQAIKLLQMGSLDLSAYVETELERNPLLERDDSPESGARDGDAPEIGADGPQDGPETLATAAGDPAALELDASFTTASAMTERLDADMSNVYQDDGPGLDVGRLAGEGFQASGGAGGDEDGGFESFAAAEISLAEHLAQQMALAITDPARRLIGQYLIDGVDDAGYLRLDPAEVADKLGCPLALVEEVLAVLQGFEPAGVCARDLKECLKLQLVERNRFDPVIAVLLDHLDLIARRDFAALRRLCRVDDEELAEMIAEIRALNPKPGNAFGAVTVQPVVPDVLVRAAKDGSWTVDLNSETLPRVLVNQSYHARVAMTARTDADKAYLSECLQTANWLVKSLDQRARTILKVSAEIVRQQDAFLTYGVQHLRPLNLRMIAEAIGMHESTVSRVTSNKYMATSRGIFELKYFFTSAIASSEGGEAHSSESVRHRIRDLIDKESPDDILSDDTLVKMLKDEGMDIARRTVAKYREAMHIGSSVQRRREKKGR